MNNTNSLSDSWPASSATAKPRPDLRVSMRGWLTAHRTDGKIPPLQSAPVAQLDRAFGYEPKGRTFESCRAHNQINNLRQVARLPFFICDNLVTILRGIVCSHPCDGVTLAGIARVHIAHRGRDRGVPHQFSDLDYISAGC